jgi:hypothetical protein
VAIYHTGQRVVGLDEGASRSKGDSAVFVLDQDTSECLHYESITGYPPKSIAKIPRDILKDHANIEIRNDLIDCSIDVCALEARPTRRSRVSRLIQPFSRYCLCSRTTLITATLDGTLCTAFLLRIYS